LWNRRPGTCPVGDFAKTARLLQSGMDFSIVREPLPRSGIQWSKEEGAMAPTRQQVTEDFAAMAEAELVHAARLGQREACRIIMQRNNQRLFRVARAIVSNDAEAEDIVQECWMRAFARMYEPLPVIRIAHRLPNRFGRMLSLG
jgi:hypothetical protein